jgi:hypothetical protein
MINKQKSVNSVSYNEESEEFEFPIGRKKFSSDEEDCFSIAEIDIQGINISKFPISVKIALEDTNDQFSGKFITIINSGNGKATVEISFSEHSLLFRDNIGIEAYFALKTAHLLEQKQFNPKLNAYHPDGNWVQLNYTIELPADEIQNIVKRAIEFDNLVNEQIIQAIPNTYEVARTILNLPQARVNYVQN